MALTKEDLQAIGALLEPINTRLDKLEQGQAKLEQGQAATNARLDSVEESIQIVRTSQMRVELEQFPRISAALDGHKLNSEKLDAIQKNLEEITPTVQALEILHQTGYAK